MPLASFPLLGASSAAASVVYQQPPLSPHAESGAVELNGPEGERWALRGQWQICQIESLREMYESGAHRRGYPLRYIQEVAPAKYSRQAFRASQQRGRQLTTLLIAFPFHQAPISTTA